MGYKFSTSHPHLTQDRILVKPKLDHPYAQFN